MPLSAVLSIISIQGVTREFILAHSGNSSPAIYDSSCNGVWLLMKECCKEDSWGSDQTGSNGLETKVFIPSMHELGHTHDYYARKIPVDGACLAYFL